MVSANNICGPRNIKKIDHRYVWIWSINISLTNSPGKQRYNLRHSLWRKISCRVYDPNTRAETHVIVISLFLSLLLSMSASQAREGWPSWTGCAGCEKTAASRLSDRRKSAPLIKRTVSVIIASQRELEAWLRSHLQVTFQLPFRPRICLKNISGPSNDWIREPNWVPRE